MKRLLEVVLAVMLPPFAVTDRSWPNSDGFHQPGVILNLAP